MTKGIYWLMHVKIPEDPCRPSGSKPKVLLGFSFSLSPLPSLSSFLLLSLLSSLRVSHNLLVLLIFGFIFRHDLSMWQWRWPWQLQAFIIPSACDLRGNFISSSPTKAQEPAPIGWVAHVSVSRPVSVASLFPLTSQSPVPVTELLVVWTPP